MKKKILAVLLIGAMALNLSACGSADSKPEKKEEKSESNDKLEAEKNLLSVEVTLPASLVGDSAAELDQEAKDAGVKEITKNEDGSITMKMTKSAHKTLLSTFKTGIDEGIEEILADKENFSSFDSITYNDDVTEFTVNVDPNTYGGLQSMAAMAFYIQGNMYQAFNAVPSDQIKTVVNFVNKDTKEVIESGDSTQMENNE
ncbi:MAG: hypothetical protein ACLUDJ_02725 [Lachnospiraceae bacterium]